MIFVTLIITLSKDGAKENWIWVKLEAGGVQKESKWVRKKGLGFEPGKRLLIILFFLFGGSGSVSTAGSC